MSKRYLRNSPVSNNDSNTPVHLANPTGKIQEITKIEAILTRAPTYSSKYYFNIEKNGQTQEVKIFDLSDQTMIDLIAMDFELHQGTLDYTFESSDSKRLFGPNDKISISFENSITVGTVVPSYVKFKINFKEYKQNNDPPPQPPAIETVSFTANDLYSTAGVEQ